MRANSGHTTRRLSRCATRPSNLSQPIQGLGLGLSEFDDNAHQARCSEDEATRDIQGSGRLSCETGGLLTREQVRGFTGWCPSQLSGFVRLRAVRPLPSSRPGTTLAIACSGSKAPPQGKSGVCKEGGPLRPLGLRRGWRRPGQSGRRRSRLKLGHPLGSRTSRCHGIARV